MLLNLLGYTNFEWLTLHLEYIILFTAFTHLLHMNMTVIQDQMNWRMPDGHEIDILIHISKGQNSYQHSFHTNDLQPMHGHLVGHLYPVADVSICFILDLSTLTFQLRFDTSTYYLQSFVSLRLLCNSLKHLNILLFENCIKSGTTGLCWGKLNYSSIYAMLLVKIAFLKKSLEKIVNSDRKE